MPIFLIFLIFLCTICLFVYVKLGGRAEDCCEGTEKECEKYIPDFVPLYSRKLGTGQEKYTEQIPGLTRVCLKAGQTKLFMNELEFYSKWGAPKSVVIYAGSATGEHSATLVDFFPDWTFVFYDPRDFCVALQTKKNVELHKEFFTDKVATSLHKRFKGRHILFLSDIRTASSDNLISEVQENMDQQFNWCEIIKPSWAMLKFKLSWEDFSKKHYYAGEIYTQPYIGCNSAEMRLITDCKSYHDWDPTEYESRCYYYNNFQRLSFHEFNKTGGKKTKHESKESNEKSREGRENNKANNKSNSEESRESGENSESNSEEKESRESNKANNKSNSEEKESMENTNHSNSCLYEYIIGMDHCNDCWSAARILDDFIKALRSDSLFAKLPAELKEIEPEDILERLEDTCFQSLNKPPHGVMFDERDIWKKMISIVNVTYHFKRLLDYSESYKTFKNAGVRTMKDLKLPPLKTIAIFNDLVNLKYNNQLEMKIEPAKEISAPHESMFLEGISAGQVRKLDAWEYTAVHVPGRAMAAAVAYLLGSDKFSSCTIITPFVNDYLLLLAAEFPEIQFYCHCNIIFLQPFEMPANLQISQKMDIKPAKNGAVYCNFTVWKDELSSRENIVAATVALQRKIITTLKPRAFICSLPRPATSVSTFFRPIRVSHFDGQVMIPVNARQDCGDDLLLFCKSTKTKDYDLKEIYSQYWNFNMTIRGTKWDKWAANECGIKLPAVDYEHPVFRYFSILKAYQYLNKRDSGVEIINMKFNYKKMVKELK